MMESAKTPLLDLLKSIPADGQGLYEVSPIEHRNIPYGRLCKEAVDEIEQLRAENADLRKSFAEISVRNGNLEAELTTVKQQRDELVEALEEITALVAEREHWPDVVSRCRAALAKVMK